MQLKVGARLRSSADSTEVVVIRAPRSDIDIRCGGHPMMELNGEPEQMVIDAQFADGTFLGKRYVDEESSLELLCTKAGAGTLAIGQQSLSPKESKPLPSSD